MEFYMERDLSSSRSGSLMSICWQMMLKKSLNFLDPVSSFEQIRKAG